MCPSQCIVVFEKCYFSDKMKAMYRRHCLLKSRWWQEIHCTNESKAGYKNEHNRPRFTIRTSRTHPTHTWKRKSRHGGLTVWVHKYGHMVATRMPPYFHQGLGDMLMGQTGVVSVTVMGTKGALHNRRCGCRTTTLRSPIVSQGCTRRKEACSIGHDTSAPS